MVIDITLRENKTYHKERESSVAARAMSQCARRRAPPGRDASLVLDDCQEGGAGRGVGGRLLTLTLNGHVLEL